MPIENLLDFLLSATNVKTNDLVINPSMLGLRIIQLIVDLIHQPKCCSDCSWLVEEEIGVWAPEIVREYQTMHIIIKLVEYLVAFLLSHLDAGSSLQIHFGECFISESKHLPGGDVAILGSLDLNSKLDFRLALECVSPFLGAVLAGDSYRDLN